MLHGNLFWCLSNTSPQQQKRCLELFKSAPQFITHAKAALSDYEMVRSRIHTWHYASYIFLKKLQGTQKPRGIRRLGWKDLNRKSGGVIQEIPPIRKGSLFLDSWFATYNYQRPGDGSRAPLPTVLNRRGECLMGQQFNSARCASWTLQIHYFLHCL